ncbi:hypothetical protein [Streptomyces cucumeris]|uniref:hypothetical protein n=1 Tax=Streptomyces cucumeris TaxID=2962890 RepID=UPI003D728723
MAECLIEEGMIHRDVLPDLQMIDSVFEEMTVDKTADRSTVEALIEDAGWIRAPALTKRILARECVHPLAAGHRAVVFHAAMAG